MATNDGDGNVTRNQVWDYAGAVEVMIDRHVDDVWPHFFGDKKGAWSKTRYITVAGTPGEIGEVYTHAVVESGAFRGAEFFYTAIKVSAADGQLVLKISYKERGGSEQKLIGYDFLNLKAMTNQTRVILQQAFALPVEIRREDLIHETERQDEMLTEIMLNLKRTVESQLSENRCLA